MGIIDTVLAMLPCGDAACWKSWAYRWQTLLGACIAIPFAFGAIMVPIIQESGRRRRHFAAMRATMPLRLNAICAWATAAMQALAEMMAANDEAQSTTDLPPIPDGLIEGLERTIESLNNRRAVERLSDIIAEMQTLNSRMMGLRLGDWRRPEGVRLIIQAAVIYAQTASLFDFARRKSRGVKRVVPWTLVWSALMVSKLYDGTHPEVYSRLKEIAKRRPVTDVERPSRFFKLRLWWATEREKWSERFAKPTK